MTRRALAPIDLIPSEEYEQRVLARYLDLRGFDWLHVPNGGQRSYIAGAKLKAQGVKRGAPDVLIFNRPQRDGVAGVAIELKRRKGGGATEEQRYWHERLKRHGWVVEVCFGADNAIACVEGVYGK